MNEVFVAALLLAWLVILLLVAGYASLAMQVRELRGSPDRRGPVIPDVPELQAPSAARRSIVLVVARGCGACDEMFAEWPALAAAMRAVGHRTAVMSFDNSTDWAVAPGDDLVLHSQLRNPLLVAYQPALVVIDHQGAVRSATAVGSADRLAEECREWTRLPAAT